LRTRDVRSGRNQVRVIGDIIETRASSSYEEPSIKRRLVPRTFGHVSYIQPTTKPSSRLRARR
jgi:hypothetical protein